MITLPYQAEHLDLIHVQPQQETELAALGPEVRRAMEGIFALTFMEGGRVLGCIGAIDMFPHRAIGWAYLGHDLGRLFVPMFRAMKDTIYNYPVRRLEFTVDCDFEEGHRMMRVMGIPCEAECLRGFGALGQDQALYARILV